MLRADRQEMSKMVSVKVLYRALVPRSVRSSPLLVKLKRRLLGCNRSSDHDSIYDSNYYQEIIEESAVRSAGRIADSILNTFEVKSCVDVGCGTGALLEALRRRGCEVFGLEYADAALRSCRARGLDVAKFDLENDVFEKDHVFGVAISMEVAEHLPETVADRYVDLLTHLSRIVVFTAAPPGQLGRHHVNEQPPAYWIVKFQQRGFEHLEDLSERWRASWKATNEVSSWYHQNLMIFRLAGAFKQTHGEHNR